MTNLKSLLFKHAKKNNCFVKESIIFIDDNEQLSEFDNIGYELGTFSRYDDQNKYVALDGSFVACYESKDTNLIKTRSEFSLQKGDLVALMLIDNATDIVQVTKLSNGIIVSTKEPMTVQDFWNNVDRHQIAYVPKPWWYHTNHVIRVKVLVSNKIVDCAIFFKDIIHENAFHFSFWKSVIVKI